MKGVRTMLAVFTSPSRYTQGKGATTARGSEMTALGLEGPVLIIAGKTVIGLLAQTWQRSLEEAGLKHAVHRFGGECSLAEIERVKAAARELKARTIVGAGGGKVLDTARRLPPTWTCPWSIAPRWPPATLLAVPFRSSTPKRASSRSTGSTARTRTWCWWIPR